MPETLLHFMIPFTALIIYGLSIKKSVVLSSLAILPDLDVLFHIHRSITHSVIFLIIISIPILLFLKLWIPKYFKDGIIGTLVILSHPIMDTFQTYTPIIYPLYKGAIHIVCKFVTDMNNLTDLRFTFEIKTLDTAFSTLTTKTDGHIFTSLGIGITIVILIGIFFRWYKKWKK